MSSTWSAASGRGYTKARRSVSLRVHPWLPPCEAVWKRFANPRLVVLNDASVAAEPRWEFREICGKTLWRIHEPPSAALARNHPRRAASATPIQLLDIPSRLLRLLAATPRLAAKRRATHKGGVGTVRPGSEGRRGTVFIRVDSWPSVVAPLAELFGSDPERRFGYGRTALGDLSLKTPASSRTAFGDTGSE
jgi:hypothetical protein